MTALPIIATAVPVGIAFGVVLERAGLGDARVIRGQLVGRDFTVVVVMFGAIVTAMLGMLWMDALGLVPAITVATPPTDLAAQAVGAIIFGGGFGIAALCPGTACVAAASGRRDGVAAVAGVFAGTLLTPLAWPSLGRVVA
ncbi:MAG: YeeE/YedE family protein, partial [Cytophagaceae bacterium]|nr:YeeE/YedE family protein [Gemmatimonadaceae bacterium]